MNESLRATSLESTGAVAIAPAVAAGTAERAAPVVESSPIAPPIGKPIIVFTCGVFDVLHWGHAWFLERCKSLGTHLIVGLNTDDSVRRLKGPLRPINREIERRFLLFRLRSVDEVLLFSEDTPCELIKRIRPNVIVKGPGYSESNMPEAEIVKDYGGQVIILDGPPISTTEIIKRIQGSNTGGSQCLK